MHQSKLKHIIVVCDTAGGPAVQQELSGHVPSSVSITVAVTSQALEALLRKHIPDLIIVLRLKNDNTHNHNFLEVIRKNEQLDDIPVFVYTAPPVKKDLIDLLKKWRKTLLCLVV